MRLIDADALMERLGMANECDGCPSRKNTMFCSLTSELVSVCEEITEAPTIDPVKHGKWLRTPTWWAYCSVCGMELPNESNETTDYCPNCGAHMETDGE